MNPMPYDLSQTLQRMGYGPTPAQQANQANQGTQLGAVQGAPPPSQLGLIGSPQQAGLMGVGGGPSPSGYSSLGTQTPPPHQSLMAAPPNAAANQLGYQQTAAQNPSQSMSANFGPQGAQQGTQTNVPAGGLSAVQPTDARGWAQLALAKPPPAQPSNSAMDWAMGGFQPSAPAPQSQSQGLVNGGTPTGQSANQSNYAASQSQGLANGGPAQGQGASQSNPPIQQAGAMGGTSPPTSQLGYAGAPQSSGPQNPLPQNPKPQSPAPAGANSSALDWAMGGYK